MTVQILLESFPISSSGHCLLLEQYLKKYGCEINHYQDFFLHQESASLMYIALLDHFVHGVTVIVLVLFFFSRWSWLLVHLLRCWRIVAKIIGFVFITDIITVLFYMMFRWFAFTIPLTVGFIITFILLLSLRWVPVCQNKRWSWRSACMLGIMQGCALLPGISRFASTYVCARWFSLPPRKAFEMSWLVVWPLIAVAFLHSAGIVVITSSETLLLRPATGIVMIAAGIVSFYALRFVERLAYAEKLWWFGVYMIVPIIISLLYIG